MSTPFKFDRPESDDDHPAKRDLDPKDAIRLLHPPAVGSLDTDFLGRIDMSDVESFPVFPAERIEACQIVQMVCQVRTSDEPVERRLSKLLNLLGECTSFYRLADTLQSSDTFYPDADESHFRVEPANYELSYIKNALTEYDRRLRPALNQE